MIGLELGSEWKRQQTRVRFLVFLKRNSAKVTGKPVKDVCVGGCVMVSGVGLGVNNNSDKLYIYI